MILRGTDGNTTTPRKREEKLFDSQVVVKFNSKGYANTPTMFFWMEFTLLAVLGTGPTLLVMDFFKSHNIQSTKDWLRAHRIIPSLVPGGCTGLVQPFDGSINRPFKIFLSRQLTTQLISLKSRHHLPVTLYQPRDKERITSRRRVRLGL